MRIVEVTTIGNQDRKSFDELLRQYIESVKQFDIEIQYSPVQQNVNTPTGWNYIMYTALVIVRER